MTRHIPGLHRESKNGSDVLEGVFLVRVDRAFYRWHPTRPFYLLRLRFSSLKSTTAIPWLAGSIAHPKHFGG